MRELNMSETARKHILSAMQSALKDNPSSMDTPMDFLVKRWSRDEKVKILKASLESVHSEVYLVEEHNWVDTLADLVKSKQIKTLLYSPEIPIGKDIAASFSKGDSGLPALVEYTGTIEEFKSQLFSIDAAVTVAKGAIAENGAIFLWPNQHEPRLMSLVPPIHIVVLKSDTIFNTFSEVLKEEKWSEGMPTNVVFISGPSKTADIELVLAYGVHGPKELVVIIIG